MNVQPLVSMLSSLLGEHVCVAGNGLTTTFGKVHCGQMAIQVDESGGNKGKVSYSVFEDVNSVILHNRT